LELDDSKLATSDGCKERPISFVFFFCPSMTELKTDIERRNRKAQSLVCVF
jgi:guanylate kinase